MPIVSPAAYLRVYEPLAAFSPAERLRWQRYAATAPPSRRAGARRERMVALVAIVRPTLDVAGESAFVQMVDGLMFVCPWSTQLRVWQAAMEFRGGMPERIAEVFLPRRIVDPAEIELDRWRARRPELKVHIQTSTWSVPTSWFLLFDSAERMLVTGDTAERSMVYRTEIGLARRRIAEAVETLAAMRDTMPDASAVEGVTELARWLEIFHPRSRVELDYDGLVELLDDEVLRGDNSVEDLTEAVRALRQGRTDRAAEAYERVLVRWRPLQTRESAS
ncbi:MULTISPECIES: hypothetical protein [unclassified Pseudofrankia]|uniref:hypothetical protein n=1 Tax=unclassified Pseudofrankia TaxID=2994372 RepID=UPI0008DA9605|nr:MULTISPECIES: hypothetical protein [unclassified Pseudofrankia]MDT3445014.1 hypothetical protein [Pseudofrankia sp. BMG5.37]OHV68200.1 hypothetical protein BCD48_03195 [Pseudofrankia sp. BMG5.36]